jgi:hypothetical protein
MKPAIALGAAAAASATPSAAPTPPAVDRAATEHTPAEPAAPPGGMRPAIELKPASPPAGPSETKQAKAEPERAPAPSIEAQPAPRPGPKPMPPAPSLEAQPAPRPSPKATPPAPTQGSEAGEEKELHLINDMLLGEILVQLGIIKPEAIEAALRVQAERGMRFGEALVMVGGANEADVLAGIRFQSHLRSSKESGAHRGQGTHPLAQRAPRREGFRKLDDFLLGEILARRGFVTQDQIKEALRVQRATGIQIGEALVKTGATTREQVNAALSYQAKLRQKNEMSSSSGQRESA